MIDAEKIINDIDTSLKDRDLIRHIVSAINAELERLEFVYITRNKLQEVTQKPANEMPELERGDLVVWTDKITTAINAPTNPGELDQDCVAEIWRPLGRNFNYTSPNPQKCYERIWSRKP